MPYIWLMKQILRPLTLALILASPAAAQDAESDGFSEGLDLLRDGSRMILENLMDDMRPLLNEACPFFEEEMLPFLERLGGVIDDLSVYELPERLPNGDIIIRRSPDAPPPAPLADPPSDAPIEL